MRWPSSLQRARDQIREDLAADPYLAYILLLSFVLSTFWLWHRLPNFATRDERWRVVDSMEVVSFLVEDFSFESLQEGTKYWRPFGPTLYLYGLVALPAIVVAFLVGEAGFFADIRSAWAIDFFAHWQNVPAWMWWATVLPARFVNAMLAVGCVYLLYRIGTRLRDRATGRLAALLLALTWAVIVLAHEAGEDVPALFCLLLTVYLAIDYVETGSGQSFLRGCAVAGLAIAFKPTAGVAAVVLAVAFLLRARRAPDPKAALFQPIMLVGGFAIAVLVMFFAYPSVVLNGPDVLFDRVDRLANEKQQSHGWLERPAWWWYVRGSLNGLGWPLSIASVAAVAAALPRLRERSIETDGVVLALTVVATVTGVFSTWAYFRTHHLLPMFPLAILLVAISIRRLEVRRERLARGLMAALVVSTAVYAGVGTLGYATQPRDQTVDWLSDDAGSDASVETYSYDSQEAAVPHGMTIYRPTAGTDGKSVGEWMQDVEQRCPDYIVLNYQRSMLWLAPEGHSALADRWAEPEAAATLEDFLAEEGPYNTENAPYPYEVAERFGPTPPFVEDGEPFDRTWNMVRAGIYPRTIQYGDPQDFGVYGYAVVLERTGSCSPEPPRP